MALNNLDETIQNYIQPRRKKKLASKQTMNNYSDANHFMHTSTCYIDVHFAVKCKGVSVAYHIKLFIFGMS